MIKAAAISLMLLSTTAYASEPTIAPGDRGTAQFFCHALEPTAVLAAIISHKDRFTDADIKRIGEVAVFSGKCVYVPDPAEFTYVETSTLDKDVANEIDGFEVWKVTRPDGTIWFTVHKMAPSV